MMRPFAWVDTKTHVLDSQQTGKRWDLVGLKTRNPKRFLVLARYRCCDDLDRLRQAVWTPFCSATDISELGLAGRYLEYQTAQMDNGVWEKMTNQGE